MAAKVLGLLGPAPADGLQRELRYVQLGAVAVSHFAQ